MTSYPLCAVDQRPVHTDGQLCAACWADLSHDLGELVDSLVYDLDRVLAGLTKSGGSPIGIVVRTAARGIGFNETAGDLLRDLHNCLGGWVRVIAEDNALPIDVRNHPLDLAAWLTLHRGEIVRHEAVGELWAEIHGLVERARRITDRRPDRRYLGVCSAPLANDGYGVPYTCTADLYATDELASTVDCRQCGTRHHVGHRRAVLLEAVGDQLGTAAEISKAIAEYGGVEVTVERIRQWYSRGKIAQHPPRDGERWPRYRVGDVRDLLDPERTAKVG